MKNAIKILAALMLVVLALSFTGCSSENGYEQVVNKYCSAVQKNDFNAMKSIVDWDNIEKIAELNDRDYDKKEMEENLKETLTDQYENLEYKFDKGFTVEHGQIKVLKDGYEDYSLKRLQKLAKLENEAEDAETTKFVNDFVANLKYVALVKTDLTIKSNTDSSKKYEGEASFLTYCYKDKWYYDSYSGVLDYVVDTLNTREKPAGADDSGDDGWG